MVSTMPPGLMRSRSASDASAGRAATAPGWARLEVTDAGTGQWDPPRDGSADDEYGRGLAIVAALADKLGHDIRASGQTVWAEVAW
jgi:hypothetical protein